uniref:Peritrophins 3-A1 n=1 Tax=Acartia pacifica TaxID=335913 RepID=R9TFP5_ACAPC|nr:peritrophins 3-A1 precursor [Acartia pacifica]
MLLLILGLVSVVAGEPVSVCRPTGDRYFIADGAQCDRFHMCDEDGNLAAEFLCQDGLVYEPVSKQCGLPFRIDCLGSGRTLLQEPQAQGNCQRLNGKWAVAGTCDEYIDCTSGVERKVTCQNHLVFDDATGDCEHPDTANRAGCTAEELYGFECPNTVGQARYPAETDCRAFFTCGIFTNYHPRLGGCPVNSVFNPASQACDDPENVPGCENYYSTA